MSMLRRNRGKGEGNSAVALQGHVDELEERMAESLRNEFFSYLLRMREKSRADALRARLESEAQEVAGMLVKAIRNLPDDEKQGSGQ